MGRLDLKRGAASVRSLRQVPSVVRRRTSVLIGSEAKLTPSKDNVMVSLLTDNKLWKSSEKYKHVVPCLLRSADEVDHTSNLGVGMRGRKEEEEQDEEEFLAQL